MDELSGLVTKQNADEIPTTPRSRYNCEHCQDLGHSISIVYFGKDFPGFFYPKKFYTSIVNYQKDWIRMIGREIYMDDLRAIENYHCYTDRAIQCTCSSKHKFVIKTDEHKKSEMG